MASILKRGPYQFQVTVRRKGYPAQTRTFETKSDANAWARLIESEMDRGVFLARGEEERTTLKVALDRYAREVVAGTKSATITLGKIERWKKHPLASRYLGNLRSSDFAAHRDKRRSDGKAENTIRLELVLISTLFETARKEWGMETLANPLRNIRKPRGSRSRSRRLSALEERLVFQAANIAERNDDGTFAPGARGEYFEPLLRFALETGMRREEISRLRWHDVDLDRRCAHLQDTKNGESRDIPLSPAALDVLRGLRELNGEEAAKTEEELTQARDRKVFEASPNAISSAWRRCRDRAKGLFQKECEMAGVPVDSKVLKDLRFHDLRHEAITRLAGKLSNVLELSAVSGHKSLQVLKRYYNPRVEDLADKLARGTA